MNQEITKETIKKLMEIKGEVRGVVFKTDGDYILKEKGKEGLKKLEDELEKLGYPIKYKEIETMAFYPVGLRALSLLAIKKIFNFDDEKIKEMGFFATKKSLIVKLFIRYFLSVQRVFFKEAPKIWKEHWTTGDLIPLELDEEKKYAILKVENFNLHHLYCYYLRGYFSGILQLIVKSPQITCEEIKCYFRGDRHHKYLLKWK
ncbi:4-vinyl reductase [Patescibacteria group bacterium]|nr:4-vinyl reductase [Patescibacteria group bacterium]